MRFGRYLSFFVLTATAMLPAAGRDESPSGRAQAPPQAVAGKIEPELVAGLPPSDFSRAYFAGKTYWYWLKLSPASAEYLLASISEFKTDRTANSREFGESILFQQKADVRSLLWTGNSFRFQIADANFAKYACPPGVAPARIPGVTARRIEGTMSDDGRKILKLKVTQTYKHCDVKDKNLFVATKVIEAEFTNLPLRKATGLLMGERRGVILEYGFDEADMAKHLVRGTPKFLSGKLSFQFSVTEEPRPGIAGRVTARKTAGTPSLPGAYALHPDVFPLAEAAVSLYRDGALIQTEATSADGSYFLGIKGPADKLTIKIELKHGASSPSVFRIVLDAGTEAISAETPSFSIPANLAAPIQKDIEWSEAAGLTLAGIAKDRLYDTALAYYYIQQAWQLISRSILGRVPALAFDPPLMVRTFSTDPVVLKQDAYGDMSKPDLGLSAARSRSADNLRPGTIWHELGHVIMGVMVKHEFPRFWENPAWKDYHAGFENPDTISSYIEGFATFFAALVNTHIGKAKPGVIDVNIYSRNLSLPEDMPWTQRGEMEEFAVASLLWDLVDGDRNTTRQQTTQNMLQSTHLDFDPPFPGDTPAVDYADEVEIEPGRFFGVLSAPSGLDLNPSVSSESPVWDIRQLYSVLKAEGFGQKPAADHPDLTRLDEVFIAHGFFADAKPQNLFYDKGEEIGYAANGGVMEYSWPDPNGSRQVLKKFEARFQPKRRIPPPPPGTRLAYTAVDAAGRPVDVRDFEVEVKYGPPYDSYGYRFLVSAPAPGFLPVLCADPMIPSTTVIRPLLAQFRAERDLEITGEAYWTAMSGTKDGVFLKHEFKMIPEGAAAAAAVPVSTPGTVPVSAGTGGGYVGPVIPKGPGVMTIVLVFLGAAIAGLIVGIVILRRRK